MAGVAGRVAIVTGAAQGIGLAIARRLAEGGASVMMIDVNAAKLDTAAVNLAAVGAIVGSVPCDVSRSDSVAAAVAATVDRFGAIHILVNNAGGSGHLPIGDIENVTDEIWDAVINANLRGSFYFMRAVTPIMKQQRHGRIINFSSVVARGFAGPVATVGARIPYASAKSGIEGLTRQVSKDLFPFEITVNAVVPGLIMTEPGARMHERFGMMDQQRQEATIRAFNDRPATGEDVAEMVAYLAADETSRVTGQEIGIGMV